MRARSCTSSPLLFEAPIYSIPRRLGSPLPWWGRTLRKLYGRPPPRPQRGFIRPGGIRTVRADARRPHQVFAAEDQRQPLALPGRYARFLQQVLEAASRTADIGSQALAAAPRANRHGLSTQPRHSHARAPCPIHGEHAAQLGQRHVLFTMPAPRIVRPRRRQLRDRVQPALEPPELKVADADTYARVLLRHERLPQRLVEPVGARHARAAA